MMSQEEFETLPQEYKNINPFRYKEELTRLGEGIAEKVERNRMMRSFKI